MGIVGDIAASAASSTAKRGLASVFAGFTGLFSLKTLLGIVTGIILLMGAMWWLAARDRDTANERLDQIGGIISAANGASTIKRSDMVGAVQIVVTERTVARRERDAFKKATETQSEKVRLLNEEGNRMRAEADEKVRQVQTLTRQRDHWITEAQGRATRTQQRSMEEELRQMEGALDALYAEGF